MRLLFQLQKSLKCWESRQEGQTHDSYPRREQSILPCTGSEIFSYEEIFRSLQFISNYFLATMKGIDFFFNFSSGIKGKLFAINICLSFVRLFFFFLNKGVHLFPILSFKHYIKIIDGLFLIFKYF